MSKVDVTGDYGPMLMAAAKRGNVELLNRIITENSSPDLNIQDGLGNTALHYSASANHTGMYPNLSFSHREISNSSPSLQYVV